MKEPPGEKNGEFLDVWLTIYADTEIRMIRRTQFATAASVAISAILACAQPAKYSEIRIASIKPSPGGAGISRPYFAPGGRYTASGVTVKFLDSDGL